MELARTTGEGASLCDSFPAGIGQSGVGGGLLRSPQSNADPALLCSSYFPTLCGVIEGERERRGTELLFSKCSGRRSRHWKQPRDSPILQLPRIAGKKTGSHKYPAFDCVSQDGRMASLYSSHSLLLRAVDSSLSEQRDSKCCYLTCWQITP